MSAGQKQQKRPKIKEAPESAELRAAFEKWAEEHGMIWFDNDTRLDLVWGGDVKKGKKR